MLIRPSQIAQPLHFNPFPRTLIGVVAAVSIAVATGCGCGVVATPSTGPSDGGTTTARVTGSGAVEFTSIAVGQSETFAIPVKDTADTNETITGAMLTGKGAADFKILSSFPIPVPAGEAAFVQVAFSPQVAGSISASLVLETQMMGPSPIPLAGSGLTARSGAATGDLNGG